jgi:hypothetical protein
MLRNVLRDLEVHPLTREAAERDMAPWRGAVWQVLSDGLGLRGRGQAALRLALEFGTWRSLVRDSRLATDEAVAVMMAAVRCAGEER